MPLNRVPQTLVVVNKCFRGSTIEYIRDDIYCEAVELVEGVVRLSIRQYAYQMLCMPFRNSVIRRADSRSLLKINADLNIEHS
jgi:hypothetical protein